MSAVLKPAALDLCFERLRADSPLLPVLAQAHLDEGWGYTKAKAPLERVQGRLARMCELPDLPQVHVATAGGELVASAILNATDPVNPQSGLQPFITGVYVAPPYRGQGVARVLLAYVENVAAERGFTATHLDCKDELGEMYRHLGYEPIDKRQWREFVLTLMQKRLEKDCAHG